MWPFNKKNAGKEAYEEDVRRLPLYGDGRPRKTWDELCDLARASWDRTPTPREYKKHD